MDYYELLLKAGPLLWPIAILSVVGVAVTGHRVTSLWLAEFRNRAVVATIVPLLERGQVQQAAKKCHSAKGPVAMVLKALFEAWLLPESKRKALVTVAAERELREVERGLRTLAVIARVAPLIGLLGTVIGLVEAFIAFSSGRGQPDPALLADGIWKALLTTVAGLIVAIPAIFAHEWCAREADAQLLSMKDAVAVVESLRGE